MMFMIKFRGGRDSEKATRSLNEFWLLARKISPKAVEELVSKYNWGKEFLADLDKSLAKIVEEAEEDEVSVIEQRRA